MPSSTCYLRAAQLSFPDVFGMRSLGHQGGIAGTRAFGDSYAGEGKRFADFVGVASKL